MKRTLISLLIAFSIGAACQENHPEVCDDGLDNDGNDLIDCADLETCASAWNCEEVCDDDLDNDLDGDKDCSDDECSLTELCLCAGEQIIMAADLPVSFEGDTAKGVDAGTFICLPEETLEVPFHMVFPDTSVDVRVEALDGVPMAIAATDECEEFSMGTCEPDGTLAGAQGFNLFFVSALEAGKTGRFRITFAKPAP